MSLALLATAAQADEVGLRLGLMQQGQLWRETGTQGQSLVREDGHLQGLDAGLAWALRQDLLAQFGLTALWGARDYAGQTNRGVPASSRSDIGHTALTAGLGWRPEGSGSLQLQAGLLGMQWQRRLRDTDMAAGYPERYRLGLVTVGLRWDFGSAWQGSATLGAGPGGRNRLGLPGRDPVNLPLGQSRLLRAGLAWQALPHWQWGLGWEHLSFAAGPSRLVTLQGVPVQSASQPRTALSTWTLHASWTTSSLR